MIIILGMIEMQYIKLPKEALSGCSYDASPLGQLLPITPPDSNFIHASSGFPSRQFVPAAAEAALPSIMNKALFSSSEPVATPSSSTAGLLQ